MAGDLVRILRLEAPIIVQLGERQMRMREVMSMMPGTIIELPKPADSELELFVNNKAVGSGSAVKVGENFGIRISYIGNLKDRIEAMGGIVEVPADDAEAPDADEPATEEAETPAPTEPSTDDDR